jgi:DNA damage-binding protein 1
VQLRNDGRQVQSVHLELLGETSCASSVSYLDNGVVFIGSCFGDSQLIKLNAERDASGSYIQVKGR